ncbi:hypothetical protein AX16_002643 [Volvariella volvacea WC 439]|nr:hypothetical protein AX16_002643 [Volvariella volvacea WC 439]
MPAMHAQPQQYEEDDSLLAPENNARRRRQRNKFDRLRIGNWAAHPFWLIPVVLVFSMSRGITMAPRVEVYNDIACRVLVTASSRRASAEILADCSSSEVQGRAAKIQASVVTIMSVLSAIATGPWSRLGDAQGRKLILSLALFGALAMDIAFILAAQPDTALGRHGEQVILLGPIIDGFVGGLSTFNGVVHAYTADCTRHGSRSRIFSTIQGIVFVGLAVGPWISGLVLPSDHEITSPFYLSAAFLTATFLFIVFMCPESRFPPESLQQETQSNNYGSTFVSLVKEYILRFFKALLSPIVMFAPRPVYGHPSKRNWNLTFLGFGLLIYLISTGVYANKYLYAKFIYEWTTEQLGYYMSLLWITRALNLLVVLPLLISYFKPKQKATPGEAPSREDIEAELRFDSYLARCSLAVDGFADFMVAMTPTTSEITFIGFSCLSSFTSGGNPSLHSLGAVCLHACGYSSDVGTLFGAMAVLSAIAHIISPSLYALTYSATVGTYPQAIFLLASALLTISVLSVSAINSKAGPSVLPDAPTTDDETQSLLSESSTPEREV